MTSCWHGDTAHTPTVYPDGVYCEETGRTLLWHGDPITAEDLPPSPDETEE